MLVAKLVPRFPRTNFRPRHDNTLNIVLGGGTWGRRHLGNPKLVLERDVANSLGEGGEGGFVPGSSMSTDSPEEGAKGRG